MLNKEEIEDLLKKISTGFRKIPQAKNILYPLDINQFQKLSNYIERLETREQKLIEKLEEESKQFDKETKEIAIKINEARDYVLTDEYEEAENEEYILFLEEKYEKANIKRIRTNEILKILKGENE